MYEVLPSLQNLKRLTDEDVSYCVQGLLHFGSLSGYKVSLLQRRFTRRHNKVLMSNSNYQGKCIEVKAAEWKKNKRMVFVHKGEKCSTLAACGINTGQLD